MSFTVCSTVVGCDSVTEALGAEMEGLRLRPPVTEGGCSDPRRMAPQPLLHKDCPPIAQQMPRLRWEQTFSKATALLTCFMTRAWGNRLWLPS